ncbi:hypothetical protein [Embleya sp. AB8]|uniref:hypothetical protein n=1 Tax=Embleya sp. AB8 TaxID=3156304 RepID=UPI003C751C58
MRRPACRALTRTRTLFADPAQAELTVEIEEAYTVLMPGMWWQMVIPVRLVHRARHCPPTTASSRPDSRPAR